MDENLIKELAKARNTANAAKVNLDTLIAEIKASNEYQEAEIIRDTALTTISRLEEEIRTQALDQFKMKGDKHPSPAVEIKEFNIIVCDFTDHQKRDWCMVNLPGVLKVDNRAFEKVALTGVLDESVVSVEKEARVQIKSDLSDWLG